MRTVYLCVYKSLTWTGVHIYAPVHVRHALRMYGVSYREGWLNAFSAHYRAAKEL
jgi:hypothetical protein